MISKKKWLKEGLNLLAQEGSQGLTIDNLCRRLKITKGSFYHHFKNYSEFKKEILNFYESDGTADIITLLEKFKKSETKLYQLFNIVVESSSNKNPMLEPIIRNWSYLDEEVREIQERIDCERINYLEKLCFDIKKNKKNAQILSKQLYSIMIGCQHIQPQIKGARLKAIYDNFFIISGLSEK